jgi:hypothetical protein
MNGIGGKLGWSWIFVRSIWVYNETILIKGRLSRDVRRFVPESSPALVRIAPIKPPPRLVTSTNSDGRLPFDCQLLDPRGEELRDVDQEYESLTPLTVL